MLRALEGLVTTKADDFDPIRVGMIVGGLGRCWPSPVATSVANHAHFNALEFGSGLAAIFFGERHRHRCEGEGRGRMIDKFLAHDRWPSS